MKDVNLFLAVEPVAGPWNPDFYLSPNRHKIEIFRENEYTSLRIRNFFHA